MNRESSYHGSNDEQSDDTDGLYTSPSGVSTETWWGGADGTESEDGENGEADSEEAAGRKTRGDSAVVGLRRQQVGVDRAELRQVVVVVQRLQLSAVQV